MKLEETINSKNRLTRKEKEEFVKKLLQNPRILLKFKRASGIIRWLLLKVVESIAVYLSSSVAFHYIHTIVRTGFKATVSSLHQAVLAILVIVCITIFFYLYFRSEMATFIDAIMCCIACITDRTIDPLGPLICLASILILVFIWVVHFVKEEMDQFDLKVVVFCLIFTILAFGFEGYDHRVVRAFDQLLSEDELEN